MIVAEVACPVCESPIECHAGPWRWIHPFGRCTRPTYERLCDPDPFASGLVDNSQAERTRAKIRGQARQRLHAGRARGTRSTSLVQKLKDDSRAEQGAHRPRA